MKKLSEMTNDELARQLDAIPPFLMKEARHLTDSEDCLREAAARLRRIDERTSLTCYLKMKSGVCSCYSCKRDGDCDNCEYGDIREWAANDANTIAGLRRRLKIAEDALEKISKDDLCGHREQAARALSDIRAEGGK